MKLPTARLSDYRIVEIVKRTSKTATVRELTSNSNKIFRVKVSSLKEDSIVILDEDTAKTASTILKISNPEWGTKSFLYNPDTSDSHSFGKGFNSSMLMRSEMHLWRVITTK